MVFGDMPTGLLLVPERGDHSLRGVLRKLELLGLRRLLAQADVGPALATAHARFCAFLLARARRESEAVRHAVGAPDVLAPLLCMESRVAAPQDVLPALVPSFLLALARGAPGIFDESVLWDVPVTRIPDPDAGRAYVFEPAALGLVADRDGIEVRLASGALVRLSGLGDATVAIDGLRVETWFHSFSAAGVSIDLALADTNPIAWLEAHPDKQGNAIDLGGRSVEDWCAALASAIELVALGLPTLAAELALSLRRIVPVGFEPERHLSASYREAPGIAYLTLHPSEHVLAEAIVHETQHGKLNALSWFDPVLRNGHEAWTQSPVRPDLRPLMGVLLAVHAFVPVAAMQRRLADIGHPVATTTEFQHRRAKVMEQNSEGLDTLARLGDWTPLGERLHDDLARLHAWSVRA